MLEDDKNTMNENMEEDIVNLYGCLLELSK